MILSDTDIYKEIEKGHVKVIPYNKDRVQPASIDLTLKNSFRVFSHQHAALIDPKQKFTSYTEEVKIKDYNPFIIHPGEFVLGSTIERVEIPIDMVARIEGKSSLGRLGIIIHATAGFIDPGFKGELTLEISNVGKIPVALYPGMRIAQLSLMYLSSPATHPYGEKNNYQEQTGATESKLNPYLFK